MSTSESRFPRAARVLDAVQHPTHIDAFAPSAFLDAVRAELAAPAGGLEALGQELDALRGLLDEIERFTQKLTRIRLVHEADVLPPKLRTLVHSTVVAYAGDLALLRERVGAAMARVDPRGAAETTERVVESARAALATRGALREGVLAIAREVAQGWLPLAARGARDRSQPDLELDRWRRGRVDLESIVARPETLAEGSFEERLARIQTPAVLPDDEEEKPHRFSLLEID